MQRIQHSPVCSRAEEVAEVVEQDAQCLLVHLQAMQSRLQGESSACLLTDAAQRHHLEIVFWQGNPWSYRWSSAMMITSQS